MHCKTVCLVWEDGVGHTLSSTKRDHTPETHTNIIMIKSVVHSIGIFFPAFLKAVFFLIITLSNETDAAI